jgi:hypothetical protein
MLRQMERGTIYFLKSTTLGMGGEVEPLFPILCVHYEFISVFMEVKVVEKAVNTACIKWFRRAYINN